MRYLPLLLVPSLAFAQPFPAPEVGAPAKLDLPAVPKFELAVAADGLHTVRELMLIAKPIGKEVKVGGYVVAIYRCPQIDTDPTQCERPKVWLGDTKTTPKERALWIVDVPRPPSKLEKERLPKEDLAKWPEVPKLAVGDYVVVSGTFDVKSPHSESNSDGLVVYAGVSKAGASAAVKTVAAPEPPVIALQPVVKPPPPTNIDAAKRDESMRQLNAGNKLVMTEPDKAIAAYQLAVAAYPVNYLAFYGMGGSYAVKGDWANAEKAFGAAVALEPEQAMFQMWLGVARYERGHRDEAREPLLRALKAEPRLWRASYYLGRITRDGYPRAAADYFTRAITDNPKEEAPYIALTELYRRWGFAAQAIQVASQGVSHANQRDGALTFALGNAYEDNKQHDKAIEQLTLAIGAGASQAYFARANAKLAKGDKAGAKHDYAEFVKVGKNPNELQIAQKQLLELR